LKELVKVEALTAADMAAEYQVTSAAQTEKEMLFFAKAISASAKISLKAVFEFGKRCKPMKVINQGQFAAWVNQTFAVSAKTANRYIALFEHYKDKPRELFEKESISEAYTEAGIGRLIDPPAAKNPLQIAGKQDSREEASRMVAIFKKPTVSGRPLKNHRVDIVEGTIYIYREDTQSAMPAVDVYVPQPPGLPDADWLEMQKSFVVATELYLEKIEQYEERGLVEAPEDGSLPAVMGRMEDRKKQETL
jgi:hypothetical protein